MLDNSLNAISSSVSPTINSTDRTDPSGRVSYTGYCGVSARDKWDDYRPSIWLLYVHQYHLRHLTSLQNQDQPDSAGRRNSSYCSKRNVTRIFHRDRDFCKTRIIQWHTGSSRMHFVRITNVDRMCWQLKHRLWRHLFLKDSKRDIIS